MKNFNHIYETIYNKCHEPLEKLRKKERNKVIIKIMIVVIIGIILMLKIKEYAYCLIPWFFVIILNILSLKKGNDYNTIFKKTIIKTLVNEYNENLEYDESMGVPPSLYKQAEFEGFNRFKSEDGISGILKGNYKIRMSEVHTEKKYKNKNYGSSYITLFYGLFARIEIDKYIADKIQIRENTIRRVDFGERVELDSEEFEKIYEVYSKNKIVTLQLLTADIMQMFINFKKENKIIPELTINGNKIYIRFYTGNLFEAKIFKNALDYETLKKYYDAIDFTLTITEKILKTIKETDI